MKEIIKVDELEDILTQQEPEKPVANHQISSDYEEWQKIYIQLNSLNREVQTRLEDANHYLLKIGLPSERKNGMHSISPRELLGHIDNFLNISAIADPIFSEYLMPLITYSASYPFANNREEDSPLEKALRDLKYRTKSRKCQIENYGERAIKIRGKVATNTLELEDIKELQEIVWGYSGAISSLRNWLSSNVSQKAPYEELLEIAKRYKSQKQIETSN